MDVAGILVARTDAESATFLDNRSDERDQPFILGATNLAVPSYKAASMAILRRLHELGVDESRGHLLAGISEDEYAFAYEWIARTGLDEAIDNAAKAILESRAPIDATLDEINGRFMEAWRDDAGLKTFGEAVADVLADANVTSLILELPIACLAEEIDTPGPGQVRIRSFSDLWLGPTIFKPLSPRSMNWAKY